MAPPQTRLTDLAKVSPDAHGCPACPHTCVGPQILGSPTVFVNSLPAIRLQDMGVHAVCCGPNMYQNAAGSSTVFINGKPAVRKGDRTQHCGGVGKTITGSPNVFTGG